MRVSSTICVIPNAAWKRKHKRIFNRSLVILYLTAAQNFPIIDGTVREGKKSETESRNIVVQ